MYRIPQSKRLMQIILVLAGIALFLSLIVAAFVPEIFLICLIFIILMVGCAALFLKIYEWFILGPNE